MTKPASCYRDGDRTIHRETLRGDGNSTPECQPASRPRECAQVAELSERVKRQISNIAIHDDWETTYRTDGNERFFEQAFNHLVTILRQPRGASALDIGCGVGANAVRMARLGYLVTAADYSESVLDQAKQRVRQLHLKDQIAIVREDALSLSFPADRFDCVLCWGVLMHIPDIETAIAELVRVTRPGGFIVLEEINMWAPEAMLMRAFWRIFRRRRIGATRTSAGIGHTTEFAGETLFWRHASISWLRQRLSAEACDLVYRGSSMFTEMYRFAPAQFLTRPFYAWNRIWLRFINRPQPAMHNVLVFRKR